MRYDNSNVRRQDYLLDAARAEEILREGEYGILSMASEQGGYGVPVSYAVDGDKIYLHCASEGRKLRAIAHDPRVSFCVVGRGRVIAQEFTTEYESVIAQGRARIVGEEDDRRRALRLIVDKYSPQYIDEALTVIERLLHRTTVIAIDVESYSGKKK